MKCPGQDMQYWKDDAIFDVKCPECDAIVEFYKDDTSRKCSKCGHRFVNPKMDFGCAAYCQFAEQCLGTLPDEFVMQQDNLLKDRVAVEMKRYFKSDFKKISHAMKTARYAEKLGKLTEGTNLALLLCSAYLLPVVESEQSKNINVSSEMVFHAAKEILLKLKADEGLVNSVCNTIELILKGNQRETIEQKILQDAVLLRRIEDMMKDLSRPEKEINQSLSEISSQAAREEANELLAHS